MIKVNFKNTNRGKIAVSIDSNVITGVENSLSLNMNMQCKWRILRANGREICLSLTFPRALGQL